MVKEKEEVEVEVDDKGVGGGVSMVTVPAVMRIR